MSSASAPPLGASRRPAFVPVAVILAAITLLVMGRLCFNDFSGWDDGDTVAHNPLLNPPTLATLQFYYLHSAHRIYAPLTYTVWAALALVARVAPDPDGIALDPLVFHAANVLLHVLAALVVFRILFMIWSDRFAALCGALVFAIHPIQVEAVAWVSGLKDILSGLLSLVALWQYLRFAIDEREGERRLMTLLICGVSLILAMLAKSSAATVPLALIGMDRWIVRRPWKSIFPSSGILLLCTVPFIIIAKHAQAAADILPTPLWQRPLIACDSLCFYLWKLVWPMHLCIDYGRTPQAAMEHAWIYAAWLVPVMIAVVLAIARKRVEPLIAAAIVFVAGCLPTLGLTSFATQFFSTTADHYLYWGMLGPAIAVTWVLTIPRRSTPMRVCVGGAIIGLAVLAVRQTTFWNDDIALFEHAAAINPQSFLAFNNLGDSYYRQMNAPLAAAMFRRAIDARQDYALAHSNLAAALRQLGQLDESTRELQIAIALQRRQPAQLRISWTDDLNHLAQNLLETGRASPAAAALRESLAADPDQPQVMDMLARADAASVRPATTQSPALVTP